MSRLLETVFYDILTHLILSKNIFVIVSVDYLHKIYHESHLNYFCYHPIIYFYKITINNSIQLTSLPQCPAVCPFIAPENRRYNISITLKRSKTFLLFMIKILTLPEEKNVKHLTLDVLFQFRKIDTKWFLQESYFFLKKMKSEGTSLKKMCQILSDYLLQILKQTLQTYSCWYIFRLKAYFKMWYFCSFFTLRRKPTFISR